VGGWGLFPERDWHRVVNTGWPLERINRRDYSILRAVMGEMEAARFAGIMAAKKEQTASAPAAMVNASGSQEETPYN
jgi:hypothetical protein